MKSVMTHRFSEVPSVEIPRSSFNRSHGLKTTFDAGKLVPIYIDEVIPGDTVKLNMNAFARLSTPIHPVMDNMRLETFFFFVPNRLLWDNWQKFCGEQVNPADSTDFTIPIIDDINNSANETLEDYFGLPTKVAAAYDVNALPFRAYNLIWNEWFRDQNLFNSMVVPTGNGPDAIATFYIRSRCKRHDYFTSCLPWTQKGDAVEIPLGASANITGIAKEDQTYTQANVNAWDTAGTNVTYPFGEYTDIGVF